MASTSRLSTAPISRGNFARVDKEVAQPASPASGQPAWFAPTRWSVVLASARTQAPGTNNALSELCKTYWQPLYTFARHRGHSHHHAQDLIQGFFLSIIESNSLTRVDPSKGKFRSYLLASLQKHMLNERSHAHAQKRGGGKALVSLDDDNSEHKYESAAYAQELSAEALFEREWAIAAVETAISRLEADFTKRGKLPVFLAMKPFLLGDQPQGAYDTVAEKLGLKPGAIRTGVHRLRIEFREHLQREIAKTVDSPDQIDEEMRHLRTVLSTGT